MTDPTSDTVSQARRLVAAIDRDDDVVAALIKSVGFAPGRLRAAADQAVARGRAEHTLVVEEGQRRLEHVLALAAERTAPAYELLERLDQLAVTDDLDAAVDEAVVAAGGDGALLAAALRLDGLRTVDDDHQVREATVVTMIIVGAMRKCPRP